jgi:hypothetical protein
MADEKGGSAVPPTSDAAPAWRVEATAEDHCYRFVNLRDHAAWRVVIHGVRGSTAPMAGHVGYGRGSFLRHLEPGVYRLRWDDTLSLLRLRTGERSRPERQSKSFEVPLDPNVQLI